MKKTYISPEFILVELSGIQMLAESIPVDLTGETTASGNSGGWVKEQVDDINSTVSDKNIWDDEW